MDFSPYKGKRLKTTDFREKTTVFELKQERKNGIIIKKIKKNLKWMEPNGTVSSLYI